jgi:uncharacterized protein (TIGR02266 family)
MVSDEQGSGSGADRRLAPRILVDIEVDYACEDTYLFAYITDMSAFGIFVRTNAPEPKGTELHLRFTPPGEAKSLAVEGRVVWLNPYRPGDMDNTHPGMGIEFVNLDELTRERLVELVRKIAYIDREGD